MHKDNVCVCEVSPIAPSQGDPSAYEPTLLPSLSEPISTYE